MRHVDVDVPPHPLRVRPLGSRLWDATAEDLRDRLGVLRALPDDLLLRVLALAGAQALSRCACSSRCLRVLAYTEELWKTCLLTELEGNKSQWLQWDTRGWRHSYLRHRGATLALAPPAAEDYRDSATEELKDATTEEASATEDSMASPDGYYYSDVLYDPWFCGTASLPERWSRHDSIPRVSAASLSVEEFAERFEASGRPVVLTDATDHWPARHKWGFEQLRARYGDHTGFHVGGHTMSLTSFLDYCESTTDEQPLYLFDKAFEQTSAAGDGVANGDEAARSAGLASEYTVPDYFASHRDLFSHLPPQFRPDHRWLIMGTTRSGSGWHVDPNATSAWNACIVGRKKWVLTPPHAPPPGVDASEDGASVTSPISLYEWFRVFHSSLAELRREATHGRQAPRQPRGPAAAAPPPAVALEAVVGPGDVIFIPAGWWHCCLNLEPSIALTGNYAPKSAAKAILSYLQAGDMSGELVSGLPEELRPKLAEKFADVLRQQCPEALQPADDDANATASSVTNGQANGATAPSEGAVMGREAHTEFRFSFA